MKCQCCKNEEAIWAWQPFGPNESPDSFMALGDHYRGFPVIKVGEVCKDFFQAGKPVNFTHRAHEYSLRKD